MFKIMVLSFCFVGSLSTFGAPLEEKLSERRQASREKVPPAVKKVMNDGVQSLKDLGLHQKALGVGKKVPIVNFQDLKGKRVSLNDYYGEEVLVLTFYRGGWCPYCMLELDAYQLMINQFKKAGAKIVAVSPDTPFEAMKTKKKRDLTFTILSDPDNRGAKSFGLAFKVDEGTLGVYKKFGIDLKKSQGNENNELPMPGTYVIDKKGVIRYSFVDPDYTKRAEPMEVLKVVQSL